MADGDNPARVEVELALRDAMSAALVTVGREMAKLNKQAQESSQSGSGLGNFGTMLGAMSKNLIGPIGIVAGFAAAAKGMAEFATSRVQFEYFARDLRVSAQSAGIMSTALDRLGVDGKQAFANLAGAMKEIDIKRWNSDFLQAIAAMPEGGQEFANKLFNAKTVQERIDIYLDTIKKAGPNAQSYLAALIHVPEHALLELEETAKKINRTFTMTPEMKQYKEDWDNFWDDYAEVVETVGQRIFRAYGAIREGYKELGKVTLENPQLLPPGQSALGSLLTPDLLGQLTPESQLFKKHPEKPGGWFPKGSALDYLFKRQSYEEDEGALPSGARPISFSGDVFAGMQAFEKGGILGALQARGQQLPPWLQKAYQFLNNPDVVNAMASLNPLAMPGAIPTRGLMAEMPVSAATGLLDWRRRLGLGGEDSHAILVDIRDILQRIEEKPSAGREAGQQAASLYGTGIRGGQMQAGLGGFRPGYGGQTRADRNNNPGNIKYGDFAKAQGATGADESGFAIFPDKETGFKASETLLSSKGYSGLTLSQIGQQWAAGDQGWAANVSKATGIPLEAVPTPEQRTQMARIGIPRAEGFGGGGGGGAIPSDILSKAREAALTGGPGAVYKFIRSQGYNVDSAWCGDFAAAVVKAAGGTPPRNPQVASNWRNYGQEVRTPQAGDIAVRRGAPTGAMGSHVTVVEGYDPETGRFVGIGGNQGAPRSRYPVSGYQFYRDDYAAFRSGVDNQIARAGKSSWEGAANIEVDFKNVPRGVRTSVDQEGFKTLKIKRDRQGEISDRNTADNTWAYE